MLAAAVREAGGEAFRAGARHRRPPRVHGDAGRPARQGRRGDHRAAASRWAPTSRSKRASSPLGTVRFEKVAMQPGMPQGFGVVGDDQIPIFTLPGNPVSSYVSFVLFVRPALRQMQGLPASLPGTVRRRLRDQALRSPQGRRSYLRRRADRRHGHPARGQGSHQLAALAAADALIVVPEDVTEIPRGYDRGSDPAVNLTHLDESGAARMVDVSEKPVTVRTATASAASCSPRRPWRSCARATPRRATPSEWPASPGSWAPRRRPT